MSRTITAIKEEMTGYFVSNETVIDLYGLAPTKNFESQFSKVSLESILFYVVAAAIWSVEVLFDKHKEEVSGMIAETKPHRLKWYVDKVLAFQAGRALLDDSDVYDNATVTAEQITTEQVVKYSAAMEQSGRVVIKVTGTGREPLSPDQEAALLAYLKEIKDAGVAIELVNRAANAFTATLDIYYNPMILNAQLSSLSDGGSPVREAIEDFITNLQFNGEYRNSALVDRLQAVPGVVIPQLHTSAIDGAYVSVKSTPSAGYMKVYEVEDLILNPIAYETISN